MSTTDPLDGRLGPVRCPWRNTRISYGIICGKNIVWKDVYHIEVRTDPGQSRYLAEDEVF